MTLEERAEIDRLVGIWIDALTSASNDAGWEGMSLAARLIEFQGEPPPPTGNDQSNITMINAIRLLRAQGPDYPTIASAVINMRREKPDQMMSLMAKNYYRGLNPESGKAYSDADRAEYMDMTLEEFRYCLKKAYHSMYAELQRAKTYREYFFVDAG